MRKAIIVDIDNVLMDSRIPDKTQPNVRTDRAAWREWQPELVDCVRINETFTLIEMMQKSKIPFPTGNLKVFLLTSRESTDTLLRITQCQVGTLLQNGAELLMRAEDENRTSAEVKRSLYESVIKGRYDVMFAIDDLEENIEMFKSLGIKTLQFRYGDEK